MTISITIPRRRLLPRNIILISIWMIICQCLFLWPTPGDAASSSTSSSSNPYSILGVSKDATQDEITKKYRQNCLKYHPDKNVNLSQEEQEQCENTFKKIQEAYSLIGTKDDRQKYDTMSRLQQRYGTSGNRSGSGHGYGSSSSYRSDPMEAAFQQFFEQGGVGGGRFGGGMTSRSRGRRRTAFYVNGVDVSHLFDPTSGGGIFGGGGFFGNDVSNSNNNNGMNTPKSIYVQHVTVPLEELYSGIPRSSLGGADRDHLGRSRGKELFIHDNIVQRYKAAFRGGIATQLMIQGFLASIPLFLRTNRPTVSILCFIATFHLSLPRPTRLSYFTKLKAGWKGGTKLRYSNVEPGMDVVFILREGRHERFTRVGNDLRTEISIGRQKAKEGCTIFIEPLDESREMPIMVKLKPGEINQKRQVVTVSNKGWPYGKDGQQRGDLLIVVSVVSDDKAEKDKDYRSRSKEKRKKKAKSR